MRNEAKQVFYHLRCKNNVAIKESEGRKTAAIEAVTLNQGPDQGAYPIL